MVKGARRERSKDLQKWGKRELVKEAAGIERMGQWMWTKCALCQPQGFSSELAEGLCMVVVAVPSCGLENSRRGVFNAEQNSIEYNWLIKWINNLFPSKHASLLQNVCLFPAKGIYFYRVGLFCSSLSFSPPQPTSYTWRTLALSITISCLQ